MFILADVYLSDFKDWVHPESIIGVIVVLHAEIGQRTRGVMSHAELLRDNVFFYNATYIPRSSPLTFGTVIPIPLPGLESGEWPLPDMYTTEAFRARFRTEFQYAMRPTTGNKQTHFSCFLPIHVFVDLFVVASSNVTRKPTMFVFKPVKKELTDSLMDQGWNIKVSIGVDHIKCTVDSTSLVFRYHIGRSILYTNFVYNRERQVGLNKWQAMDNFELEVIVTIQCEMGDMWSQELEVGMSWSLSNVRKELEVYLGSDIEFRLAIIDCNIANLVNYRNEKKKFVVDLLPPKKLRLIEKLA